MDTQLQRGKADHYCFVTDCPRRARGKDKRGAILFKLEFVHAVTVDKETSEIDNVPEGERTFTVAEFAAWWAANPEWRVVDV